MDDVDITNDRVQRDLEARIAVARGKVPHDLGPEVCNECDEPMPIERRLHGFMVCQPCAAENERQEALRRGCRA